MGGLGFRMANVLESSNRQGSYTVFRKLSLERCWVPGGKNIKGSMWVGESERAELILGRRAGPM